MACDPQWPNRLVAGPFTVKRFLLTAIAAIPLALSCIGLLTVTTELVPSSNWLEIERRGGVIVSDASVGDPITLQVERHIHRSFLATWLAEVERKEQSGYSAFCSSTGANEYAPDNELPLELDLDWWTYPVQCELPPGTYRVTTVWTLDTGFFGFKRVKSISNDFQILPQ